MVNEYACADCGKPERLCRCSDPLGSRPVKQEHRTSKQTEKQRHMDCRCTDTYECDHCANARINAACNDRTSKRLVDRLLDACVAGCTCLTKTPDIEHHDEMCTYRLHYEAWLALAGRSSDETDEPLVIRSPWRCVPAR